MRIIFIVVFLTNIAICKGQNSRFVDSEYSIIHYKTFGQGTPILIINGGPGFNSEGFSTLAEALVDLGYQAILFDQRGTGLSKMEKIDSSTITMDLMVKDIEQIRKDLKFSEWFVLGHSFGGMLANYYTSMHPEKVTAMIQSSSGGIDLSLLQTAQRDINSKFSQTEIDSLRFWRQQFRTSDRLGARKKYNHLLAKAYVYNKKHIPLIANRLMEGDLHINRLVWDNLINIEYDCKKYLENYCNPVLIIQGKQDIVSPQLAYKADSLYCNSRIVFVDHCAHYGWVDQKVKYLKEIEQFLQFVNAKPCSEKEISPTQFGEHVFEERVFRGSFSPDDSTFYFFKKIEPSGENYRIFRSSKINRGWSEPEIVVLGNQNSDLYPSISQDGKRMVFISYRPVPDSLQEYGKSNAHLWYVDREQDKWGTPVFMTKANKIGHYHSWAEFGWSDNIYFRRTTPDWKTDYTFFVRWEKGQYSEPILFDEVEQWKDWRESIKIVGGSPGPSKDIVFLDIATINKETGKRASDIWTSRKIDGGWQEPEPLNFGINQNGYDVFPFYSSDGYNFYFVRDFEKFYTISMECLSN